MEVEADSNHVAVVVKFLVLDILVFRLNILQPNESIGTVDRDSVAEEELETSSSMEAGDRSMRRLARGRCGYAIRPYPVVDNRLILRKTNI
jgi:hypothetical protein